MIPLTERFWTKVEIADDCWLWTGFIDKAGYGRVRGADGRHGESLYAHRVSYEIRNGTIPVGLHIDHLCRTRACVNPAHLEPVTCAENLRRGVGQVIIKTGRCRRGHDQRIHGYVRKDGRGINCRQCRRDRRLALSP